MNHGSEVFESRVFVDIANSSSKVATNKNPSGVAEVIENVTEAIEGLTETNKTVEEEVSKRITEVKLEANIDQERHFMFQEMDLPSKRELSKLVGKYLQPIHRQLADINGRLDFIEEKLNI